MLANLKKDQACWSNDPVIISEVNAIDSDYNRINERLNVIVLFLCTCKPSGFKREASPSLPEPPDVPGDNQHRLNHTSYGSGDQLL